jgi:23S rRNA (pseudouridine1915-N3)-methyltransferase
VRVTVAAIGRDRGGPARQLFDDYRKRSLWPLRLIELPPQSRLPLARRLAEEALRLRQSVPEGAVVVALDEHGGQLDSLAFARRLGDWRDQGRSEIAFLIGGPDGLAATVRESADLVVALGPMTWPHRLVRVLLAEQLYRAQTILTGHPYHRV